MCEERGNMNGINSYDIFDYSICCDVKKGGCGASTGWYLTKELAAEAWNRRV